MAPRVRFLPDSDNRATINEEVSGYSDEVPPLPPAGFVNGNLVGIDRSAAYLKTIR